MARTTATAVKKILDTTLDDTVIEVYINSANIMVTNNLGGSTVLDVDTLTEIEMWLTAHMIATTRERMAAKEGAEGAEITYIGKYSENLKSTPYGQMVLTLDNTNTFASLGLKKASITAITSFK